MNVALIEAQAPVVEWGLAIFKKESLVVKHGVSIGIVWGAVWDKSVFMGKNRKKVRKGKHVLFIKFYVRFFKFNVWFNKFYVSFNKSDVRFTQMWCLI